MVKQTFKKYLIIFLLLILFYLIQKSKITNELFSNIDNKKINYNEWVNKNLDLYYINLDISKERNENMINQLNRFGIKYNRFNAFNGIKIDKKFNNNLFRDFNVINYDGKIYNNKKGSLGNFISQLSCWYDFYLNSNKKYLMVMEDDISLDKNFNTRTVHNYLKLLENENWTMLKFFCFNKRIGDEFKNSLIKAKSNKQNFRSTPNTGMQCYIINKIHIKKIIEELIPINNETFDWKIKYIMMSNNIYITKKNYVSTPNHNTQSDRKTFDRKK